MSNIIPPLVSDSPPPMVGMLDDEEDDEFGDFTVAAANVSDYGCDVLSLPTSAKATENLNQSIPNNYHHDCNDAIDSDINDSINPCKNFKKDFQDKRKREDDYHIKEVEVVASASESGTNLQNHSETISQTFNEECDNDKLANNVDNKKYSSTFQYLPEIPPDIMPESNEDHDDEDNDDDYNEFGDANADFLEEGTEDFGEFQDVKPEYPETTQSDKLDETTESVISKISSSEVDHLKTNAVDVELDKNNTTIIESTYENTEDSHDKLEQNVHLNEQKSDCHCDDSDDDFNDFETHQSGTITPNLTKTTQSESTEQQNISITPPTDSNTTEVEHIESQPKSHCEDDFGDFETSFKSTPWSADASTTEPEPKNNDPNPDDSFGDFDSATFEAFPSNEGQNKDSHDNDGEDDFGDFNDYSLQSQSSQHGTPEEKLSQVQKLCTCTDPLQQAQAIVMEMFPTFDQTNSDYQEQDFTGSDQIFSHLKDITDTYALLYQWSKSQGQKYLLQALNIDTRNILYGPRWNESMPRYAATLGFAPLEPVKSEALPQQTPLEPASPVASTSSSHNPSIEVVQQSDIPSAQFDWVGSGLTNPLEITPKKDVDESTPKTEEAKVDDKGSTVNNQLEVNNYELLQPEINSVTQTHNDNGSVKSLQFNDVNLEETVSKKDDEFDDFTSFQSTSKNEEPSSTNYSTSNWSFSNTIVLRETHISNNQSDIKPERLNSVVFEEPGWLKPTILTPDLPRKINEKPADSNEEIQPEDEFSDFQVGSCSNNSGDKKLSKPDINVDGVKKERSKGEGNDDNDEEFTDFQSILPTQPNPKIQEPLQPSSAPILEPLKPVIIQSNVPTSINWPDPGITDDELMRFELSYKPQSLLDSSTSDVVEENAGLKGDANEINGSNNNNKSKGDVNDDDDWSDFVSNQEPVRNNVQPILKMATGNVSRTSTPELPLNVPQLHQIPLPKKHIPVITQQGLVQTKPTAEHLVLPSVQTQKKTYTQTANQHSAFQPSLISNQFLAQCDQGSSLRNTIPNKPQENNTNVKQIINNLQDLSNTNIPTVPTVPLSSNNVDDFDDEWTDFVSSQPAASQSPLPPPQTVPSQHNGFYKSFPPKLDLDWNRPPQFTSWSANVTTNIITNPVSFDSFQSYTPPPQTDLLKNRTNNKKNPNLVVQPKKSTISSISAVPDLEFIAPKNRTWKK